MENKKPRWLVELLEWAKSLLIVFIAVFIIINFVIVNASIPTGSMLNTIQLQDRIIASRLSYIFAQPQRGDIVVFKFPDNEKQLFVKRLIGLPGETVEIVDGDVYINGVITPQCNAYVPEKPHGSYGPYVVPQDCYFMLGDNRNYSLDSRFWNNTFVTKKQIQGKAIFRYWPEFTILK